jgi:AraC family transcriptional regulator
MVLLIGYENESLPAFLHSLSAQAAVQDGPNRVVLPIGDHCGQKGDLAEFSPKQHHLSITENYPAHWLDGRRLYAKQPGSFSFVPAGIISQMQAETPYKLLVCLIDPSLLSTVERELGRYPSGDLRFRVNFHDPALRQLMKLLHADASAGGLWEQLYRDHLTLALALRVLSLNGMQTTDTKTPSPLPYRALRRVIERMNELDDNLTLEELAKESGYSRSHFLRMFRAATSRTPHNYLIHLRLERAQELIKKRAGSLVDVAIACGYSSHSHMTQAFRRILGVTPSEYQRQFSGSRQYVAPDALLDCDRTV